MSGSERPLSPHLHIYRWEVTMATSILHRASGVFLGLGTLLLAWWLLALASGPQAFGTVHAFLTYWVGRLVLFGFTWALVYHLLNGIRHLFWDAGHGFELPVAARSGITVIVGSILLTLLAWAYGYGLIGGAL